MLGKYGLDVVAANHEFSGGQFEINLWHSDALSAADRAFQFKSAVKELVNAAGTFSVIVNGVPAPGAAALLGLGGLVA